MPARRLLIVGNWKMNGLTRSLAEARKLSGMISSRSNFVDVALCPPATLLISMATELRADSIAVGAQDCHSEVSGAHTGDVSAQMIADTGATLVILGHSERRAHHSETDLDVAAKVSAALDAGLLPVVCVGESEAQRNAGDTMEVIESQVARSIPKNVGDRAFAIAYEPMWAIGTGRTPTPDEIAGIHAQIRKVLLRDVAPGGWVVPILYGGSVNANNAAQFLSLPEVGGALVGGASLRAEDFYGIIGAANEACLRNAG